MQPPSFARLARSMAALLLPALGPACVDHPLDPVEEEDTRPVSDTIPIIGYRPAAEVDVLLVIDDTADTAEVQARLVRSLDALLEVLEDPDRPIDYRIAITTTNNGNPACHDTTPEAGRYQLRSCREHLADFVAFDPRQDATATACTDLCPEAWSHIEVAPTRAWSFDEPAPHPWIERRGSTTNLPAGLDPAVALACLVPQGIAGCGFPSTLESMWKALRRADTEDEDEYHFVRPSSVLVVLLVTTQADCSYAGEWQAVFDPEGDRSFWSDPEADAPTPAVCWNAGVACNGDDPFRCHAVDLDAHGMHVPPENADALAILRPVARYIGEIDRVQERKRWTIPDAEVIVSVIGGAAPDGTVTYSPAADDPEYAREHGIGPGCEDETVRAVPPVRLRELAEAFAPADAPPLASACAPDYEDELRGIGERIAAQMPVLCVPACLTDVQVAPPSLHESCVVTEELPHLDGHFEQRYLPPCHPDRAVPSDYEACWYVRWGSDRHPACRTEGAPLELGIARAPGQATPAGAYVQARCDGPFEATAVCPRPPFVG